MEKFLQVSFLAVAVFTGVAAIAAPGVTITSIPVAAANMAQGSFSNIIYAVKLDVSGENLTVSSIQFVLQGNYDADDLGNVGVYYNTTAASISGATFGGAVAANFAGPHAFSVNAGKLIAAGTSIYLIIAANINNAATDNHTVSIDGATNPINLTAVIPPAVINNQTDLGGMQTIQAADITFTTVAVPDGTLNQGSFTNPIYIVKMDVATEPITISTITATLTGNFDIDDLGNVGVYYNFSNPAIAGAAFGGGTAGSFSAPHSLSIPAGRLIPAGTSVYILITVNINSNATDNHLVNINGLINPVGFTTQTAPNIILNETNIGGIHTIQAADLNISTVPLPTGSLNPGTFSNIVYIAKVDVSTEPITTSSIQLVLDGNFDNDDLGSVSVYFNSAPNLSGASFGGGLSGAFSAPHIFSIPAGRVLGVGSTTFIIVTVNVNSSATDNHTIHIDGAANPIGITTTTAPNFFDTQSDISGIQTIQAADIILSTVPLLPGQLLPGSTSNIIYILKIDVGGNPVTLTNAQFTLGGNYDTDDLGNLGLYYNSNPNLTGATFLGGTTVNVGGPHTFSLPSGRLIAANTVGYMLFTVNINSLATLGNTVGTDGATEPVVFSYTTTPNITDNQSNAAGLFSIANAALPLTLTRFIAKNTSGSEVQLEWTTAKEINTKNFDVQWSTDGMSFHSAGTVAAYGNTQSDKSYSFMHHTTVGGLNYYRLKMIDVDGQFTYSPVLIVKLASLSHNVVIAPNPVVMQLRLLMNGSEQVKTVRVIDISGKVVLQTSAPKNSNIITIPFSTFPKGLYTAELIMDHGTEHIQFIKVGR